MNEDEVMTPAESQQPTEVDQAGDSPPRAADPLAEAQQWRAQADEFKDRWIRLQADFENYRRRDQRERERVLLYTGEQFILKVLPILDNLERALDAPAGDGLRVGVELIVKQFKDFLAKEGVVPIGAAGQPFDPHLHEAVMQVEGDQAEPVVAEELQKGYRMGDKVIRPCMVKVARQS